MTTPVFMVSGPGVAYTDLPVKGTDKTITIGQGNYERIIHCSSLMSTTDLVMTIVKAINEDFPRYELSTAEVVEFTLDFLATRSGESCWFESFNIYWENK